jgi:predicted nucleotidyltransferase
MRFNISFLDYVNSDEKIRLLSHLLKEEIPRSERELSAITRVSHMLVNRFMKSLQAINLVNLERVGKASVWSVNRRCFAYKSLARAVDQLTKLPRPLEHLKNTIHKRLPLKDVKRLVLFGSVARGAETPTSDIDLFILLPDEKTRKKLDKYLLKLSDLCLSLYGNRLAPYNLTEFEYKKKKNLPLLKQIENGIRIFP